MSLFQTLVLLMFNEEEEFTLEEIQTATGIGKKGFVASLSLDFIHIRLRIKRKMLQHQPISIRMGEGNRTDLVTAFDCGYCCRTTQKQSYPK